MNASQTIRSACTGCQTAFKLKAENEGKRVKCPKCETIFVASRLTALEQNATSQPAPTSGASQAPTAPSILPGMVRCDLCHEQVPEAEYAAHYEEHKGTREDGQLNQYMSLPPEERFQGSLADVPRSYQHPKCGGRTGMPEEIIRTYLVNPYFYSYSTFCTGCGTHVPQKELTWVETGENVMTYTRRLQAENPNSAKFRRGIVQTLVGCAAVGGGILGLVAGAVGWFLSGLMIGMIALLVASVVGCSALFLYLLNLRGGI